MTLWQKYDTIKWDYRIKFLNQKGIILTMYTLIEFIRHEQRVTYIEQMEYCVHFPNETKQMTLKEIEELLPQRWVVSDMIVRRGKMTLVLNEI